MDRDNFVSVSEAARIAGVTARTIRRWAASGALPYEPSERGRLVDAGAARTLAAGSAHVRADTGRTIGRRSAGRKADGHGADSGSPADNAHDPPALLATLAQLADRTRKVDELERERAELYGRLGYLQSELETARKLLAAGPQLEELQVSPPEASPTRRPPRWQFWRRANATPPVG